MTTTHHIPTFFTRMYLVDEGTLMDFAGWINHMNRCVYLGKDGSNLVFKFRIKHITELGYNRHLLN